MKIDFNQVTLHNFLSFGDATLDIRNDGFIRVSGINENPDDMAVSNGSGKSSLWEAIVWALTGETIRGTKQVSNIYGTDGTYVKLSFSVDNVHYDILRAKDSKEYKTNLLIYIDGVDKSGKGIRESEKLLQQFLPDITASLLGSVIILGQGLPQKFTSNSPSGRKEVLEQLSKSDFMIQDLKERVATRKTELTKSIREHQDVVTGATSLRSNFVVSIEKNQKTVDSMDRTTLDNNRVYLENQLNNVTQDLLVAQNDFDRLTNESLQLANNLSIINNKYLTETTKLKTAKTEASANLRVQESAIKTNITAKQQEITKRRNVKDVCPTCGQKLPGVVKLDTTELENDVKTLSEQLTSVQAELKVIDQNYNEDVQKVDHFYRPQISTIKESQQHAVSSTNETKHIVTTLTQTKTNIEKQLQDINLELQQFETIKEGLLKQIEENKQAIKELDDKILYNNCEIEKLQQHLDVQNKFDTALKRDFRGYLLLSVIEYIQNRAKSYCKTIFDTDKIGFELDGNNINITYCNKPYENLSGGEKQKVDLIVQFSIRDMLCSHLGFTSNILVLDEVFDGLDAIGCQKVLDVISAITDIKNIFIVTHRKDLSIPTDKEIVVVKSCNGISEIR